MLDARDPVFWEAIASHPEVWPHVSLGQQIDVGRFVQNHLVTPFRYDGGGFLLVRLDALGRVYELHTMFTPDAWGRAVNVAAKAMFRQMFAHADVIVTHEAEGWWRSRPPKSFGFVRASDFRPTPYGKALSTWVLTKSAWDASPAARKGV
jgi:hypothetical protein